MNDEGKEKFFNVFTFVDHSRQSTKNNCVLFIFFGFGLVAMVSDNPKESWTGAVGIVRQAENVSENALPGFDSTAQFGEPRQEQRNGFP